MNTERHNQLFPLGQTFIAPNAKRCLHPEDVYQALSRHARGDWGEVSPENVASNEKAIKGGSRLLSAFCDRNNFRFWIITEADRRTTTVLLPSDY